MSHPAHRPAPRLPRAAGESSVPPVAIVLLIFIALLVGAHVYTYIQLNEFREEVAARLASHDERLSLLDGTVARVGTDLATQVGEVRSQVETTEKQMDARARLTESQVRSTAESLQKDIAQTRETSEARISEVGGQLTEYRESTETKVGALGGRVDVVKEEVDATRAELDKTIEELTSVKGDLGVQSGLIATNGDELAALKQLGERNYYEFDLRKSNKPQRVGPVSIKLTGTDRKRNRYSIELWADDKKVVKRRKTLLEPVQFYVEGARIPFELVVNKIDNGVIGGYLATPKSDQRGS